MKTVLNVKTDKEIKKQAQKIAEEMGLPLSTIVNAYLKEFIQERQITFSAALELRPEKEKLFQKAERDYKKGVNISPALSTPEEIEAYLKSL